MNLSMEVRVRKKKHGTPLFFFTNPVTEKRYEGVAASKEKVDVRCGRWGNQKTAHTSLCFVTNDIFFTKLFLISAHS